MHHSRTITNKYSRKPYTAFGAEGQDSETNAEIHALLDKVQELEDDARYSAADNLKRTELIDKYGCTFRKDTDLRDKSGDNPMVNMQEFERRRVQNNKIKEYQKFMKDRKGD